MGYEETLANVPLFSRLEGKDLERLAKSVVPRSYAAGEKIVEEGEQAVAFYIITKGGVEVTKRGQKLNEIGSGGWFGDMALLDGYPRSATITAQVDTECLVMTRWDFTAEIRNDPNIAVAMLPILSKRIRELEGDEVR